tara:strand:+ start:599 stop:1156 length:558 start_codon:yes stop_codon:yes gene_type:complete
VRNVRVISIKENIVMVAQAQTAETQDATGVKKFVNETKEQIEKIWTDTFAQLNSQFQEREKDVRDFLNKLEADGKKRLETLGQTVKGQLNVEELLTKLKTNDFVGQSTKIGEDIVGQGLKLSEEAIEKLGLARASEVSALATDFEKLAKKMETIRKKANSAPTKKSVDELKKRITKLEKALASKK